MAYEFWNFWIFIIIDVIVILGFIGWLIWYNFLDTRLRTYIIYPNKQIKLYKKKIKNELIGIYDKNTARNKIYTVNKDFVYFKNGRIPYAFYWDNIPIPLSLIQDLKLTDKQKEVLKDIEKNLPIQLNLKIPNKKLKDEGNDKAIEIDTAETFFRVLYTNFTLNLLQPPKDIQKAIKWTAILIGIGIALALILHFLGVIDIMQLLGAKPPTT